MPGVIPTEAIYAGDAWARAFTFKRAGSLIDLVTEGYSGWAAQWRTTPDTGASIDLTVDATNAATGVIAVSLTGEQTEQMGGNGGYDLQAIKADGQPFTWLTQQFTWTQDFTR